MGSLTPRSYFDELEKRTTPLEAREIELLAAWQAAGLRAIASWRREESLDSTLPLAHLETLHGDGHVWHPRPWPAAAADPALSEELYRRYVPEWTTIAGPPAQWGSYLREAPNAFWGWSEFHRTIMLEGVNEPRVKAAAVAYLAALEGHDTWAVNVETSPGGWGLTTADVEALTTCRIERLDPALQAVLTYVEEMTYSSGVGDRAVEAVRAVLSPGQLVELGMFAGLHLASIRLDIARGAGG